MEHTQRNAAHFITGDYRSAIPSSITKFLKKMKLQPLKECRQLLHLTLYYKVVEGLVSALPPNKFLSQQKPGRLIWAQQQPGYATTNTTGDYTRLFTSSSSATSVFLTHQNISNDLTLILDITGRRRRASVIPRCRTDQLRQREEMGRAQITCER